MPTPSQIGATAEREVAYALESAGWTVFLVDAFGLWCPSLRTAYLLPIEDAPTRGGHLRLTPPANNQRAGVRFAADYEIVRQADLALPSDALEAADV